MNKYLNRFSTRVDNYIKYRPAYPPGIVDRLKANCGLTETSSIADVGSGTGILSELFLQNGNKVYGVEPNEPMRSAAEKLLSPYSNFTSLDGTAEATTLPAHSVDFVTAAQAFHWFDPAAARSEFVRILKPEGWTVLIWNERLVDSTPFLRDYEYLLLRYGTDYREVRHENAEARIRDFFAPADFEQMNFENLQHFDFAGLQGRLNSSSYAPEPEHPNFEPMLARLSQLYNLHNNNGLVTFEYLTKVFYGSLTL